MWPFKKRDLHLREARHQTRLARLTLIWSVTVGAMSLAVAAVSLLGNDSAGDPEPSIALHAEDRYLHLFPGMPGDDPPGDPWAGYGFAAPGDDAESMDGPPDGPCPQWQEWADEQGYGDVRSRIEVTVSNPSNRELIIDGIGIEADVEEVHTGELAAMNASPAARTSTTST